MSKIDMKVILGEPGTGKSYSLIEKAIDIIRNGEDLYIMTPTHAAQSRLINGYNQRYFDKKISSETRFKLLGSTHILQEHYLQEKNILIDEFNMITTDQFYSLICHSLIVPQEKINLSVYGDEKQLNPVKGVPALKLLLKYNSNKFKGLTTTNFWYYIQHMFYEKISDMQLNIPSSWKRIIGDIHLKIYHKNYRFNSMNGLSHYDLDFYDDVLKNQTITEADYSEDLIDKINKHYLLIAPTHNIGRKIDKILSDHFKDSTKNVAPFVRLQDSEGIRICINPLCDFNQAYNFDTFIPSVSNYNVKDMEFSFYTTVHYCQGATVKNSVFCMLDGKIPASTKTFYSSNLLYVALTRAKYRSEYFGNPDEFRKMLDIYPDDGELYVNMTISNEAANKTYQMIIDNGTVSTLTIPQIMNLFHKNFIGMKNSKTRQIDEMQAINEDFRIKEATPSKILSVFNPNNIGSKYTQTLLDLGYDKIWDEFKHNQMSKNGLKGASKGASKGGKIGGKITGKINGKISQTKIWVNQLNEAHYLKLKDDYENMSVRVFQRTYGHTKRVIGKYLK